MKGDFIMKKFTSLFLALVMILSLSIPAFAAEVDTVDEVATDLATETTSPAITLSVNGEDVPVTCSDISGYASGDVRVGYLLLEVPCTSSGIGGTGVTVTTSCSAGTFPVDIVLYAGPSTEYGVYTMGKYKNASSNGTYYFNNKLHYDDTNYVFVAIENNDAYYGTPIHLEVWVYG